MCVSDKGRVTHYCLRCCNLGVKRCRVCGEVKKIACYPPMSAYRYSNGGTVFAGRCYACQSRSLSATSRQMSADKLKKHTLHAIITSRLRAWRQKSKDVGVECDLDREYLTSLWESQDGKCYYTGEALSVDRSVETRAALCSLDRLDPASGYARGNVVWTTYAMNTTKGRRTAGEFLAMCRCVLGHLTASGDSGQ